MATIIEGALWTLTEAAAKHLVEEGIIYRCEHEHTDDVLLKADEQIYHLRHDLSSEVGYSNLHIYISDAEKAVEHS